MPVTEQDLLSFTRFVRQRITSGGAESFEQLAVDWREANALAADLEQAEADIAAGRGQPLAEAFADIRKQLDDIGLAP